MSRAFTGRYTLNPRIRLPMTNQPWEMHKRGSRQLGALWLAKILINSEKMRSGNIKILFQTMLWRTSEAYFVPYEISMMELIRGISWRLKSRRLFLKKAPYSMLYRVLTLSAATPQNGQTQSNNSSVICRQIVWVCLTILWVWRLKG